MLVSAVPNTLNSSSFGVVPNWLNTKLPCTFGTRTYEPSSTFTHEASTTFSLNECVVPLAASDASALFGFKAFSAKPDPVSSSAAPATPANIRVFRCVMSIILAYC